MDSDTFGRLAYLLLLIAFVGGWVVVEYRSRLGFVLRNLMAWGFIFLALAVGYGLWTDMRPQIAGLQSVTSTGELKIPRGPDGHYHAIAEINGTRISFLADTGASSIVLSAKDAEKLGIDPQSLAFTGRADTANGTVRTAQVMLDEFTLGPFTDRNVPVSITDGDMFGSLLGMDYLGRFQIKISNNQMLISR